MPISRAKARPEQVESDKGVETTPVRARWPTSPWRRNGAPNPCEFKTMSMTKRTNAAGDQKGVSVPKMRRLRLDKNEGDEADET
jgi:hypothetical protein